MQKYVVQSLERLYKLHAPDQNQITHSTCLLLACTYLQQTRHVDLQAIFEFKYLVSYIVMGIT